jgi:hypothetical protein
MKSRYLVIVACLMSFGCAGPMFRSQAAPMRCDGSGGCEVKIVNPVCSSTSCTADVDRDPVTFARGRNNITVHWMLPDGFAFCQGTTDGIHLKQPNADDQFQDAGFDGPDVPGTCKKRRFHWTGKNTKFDTSYRYEIRFHDSSGQKLYVVDPSMVNE